MIINNIKEQEEYAYLKDEYEKIFKIANTFSQNESKLLIIGNYYMIRLNNKINLSKVKLMTDKCVQFELVELGQNSDWLEIGKDFTIIEEVPLSFVRDFKIGMINDKS
jgi:hypothetical protein